MPAYLVEAKPGGRTLFDGVRSVVVFASDTTDGLAMAKSVVEGDGDETFNGATVTELVIGPNLNGFTCRVRLVDTAVDVSVEGAGTANIDVMGNGLASALNALPEIAGAGYDSGTNILTVSNVGDNLGDKTLVVEWLPPHPGLIPIPGFVLSQVHEGIAGSQITVTFASDAFAFPLVYGIFT